MVEGYRKNANGQVLAYVGRGRFEVKWLPAVGDKDGYE